MRPLSTPLRLAAWTFLLACAGWYLYANVFDQLPTESPSDFYWYHLAAQNVAHGRSPYTGGYIYPPLLAFLLVPLAGFQYVSARWAWFVISQLCLLGAAWRTWRSLGSGLLAGSIVALIWSAGGAGGESLGLGQAGPLLTLLVATAITERSGLQGVAIAGGAAIKLIPGVVVLAVILRRDRAALRAAALAGAALILVPWVAVGCCLAGLAAPPSAEFAAGTPALLNWSLPATVLRLRDLDSHAALPPDWIGGNSLETFHLPRAGMVLPVSVALVTLAAGLIALFVTTRGRLEPSESPAAGAGLMALALAASPISWTHYQVLQYPGVAILLVYFARARRWVWFCGLGICSAFLYPVPVTVLRAAYQQASVWPARQVFLICWTSAAPLACLAVFAAALAVLRQKPGTGEAPGVHGLC